MKNNITRCTSPEGYRITTIPNIRNGNSVNLDLIQGYYYYKLNPIDGSKAKIGKLSIIK